jgi:ligand-binding sensor domain-containing protein
MTVATTLTPGWTRYDSINPIFDLAFAPDGTLWAATGGGLVHWNLRTGTYTRYLVEATKVALAPDGTLWLATWQVVCRFDGTACQPQIDPAGLIDSGVRALAVDGGGVLWVGTGRGVSRFDGTSWQSYPSQVPTKDLAVAANGEVWAATAGGVGRYLPAQDAWITYTGEHGLPTPNTNAEVIAVGPGGEVWAYILWEGVYRFDGAAWLEIEAPGGGPVSGIVLDADGMLWIATTGGMHAPGGSLAFRDGETWIDVTSEHGLISIRPLALGPAGEIAIGTNLGLGLYHEGEWRLLKDGPTHDPAKTVAVTPDGAAWFGFGRHSTSALGGGLSRFDGQVWSYFLDDAGVEVLAVGPDGSLWAGAGCKLYRLDGDTWATVAHCGENMPSGNISDIAFTPDGAVWVANGFALARLDGRAWTVYERAIGSVEAAPDGTIWATGWEGTQDSFFVGRFDGQDWTIFRQADAFPGAFYPRAVTADGRLWGIVPDGRLVSFDGESWTDGRSWTFYDLPDDLSSDNGGGMAVAPDGAIWLSADGGVARFDPERAPDEAWTIYPTDGSQGRAIAFAPGGAVWFGATRFRPPGAEGGTPKPTVTPWLRITLTPTRTPVVEGTPTPYCRPSEASISLSVSATELAVGQTLTVTVRLENGETSEAKLGWILYRLLIEPGILAPESDEAVEHTLTLEPGDRDQAEFVLRAAEPGRVTLSTLASYEMHALDYSWGSNSGCESRALEIVITP